MSFDDDPAPSQNKSTSSTFTDVFKTLASGRQKSQSPVSHGTHSGDLLPHNMEGRRGSRVTFGFEALNRGSGVASSPQGQLPPDFDTLLRSLDQRQPLPTAIDEAENAARFLQSFSAEQAIAIWKAGSYLIDGSNPSEARRAGSKLLEAVTSRQDLSQPARQALFNSISRSSSHDVIPACVNSLISLTDHGRKLDFSDAPVLQTAASWILPLYDSVALARSKLKRGKPQRLNAAVPDDMVLGNLLQLIVDIIALQRHPPNNIDIETLLDQIFVICKKTVVTADIKNSLAIFDAIILTADVPDSSFDGLVEVLCGIHASVKSLAGSTSRTVRYLAKSRRQIQLVQTLYCFLLETSSRQERNMNVTRGAVDIFKDLLAAYGQDGMPHISFDLLISSLRSAAKRNDGRVETDILGICVNILEGDFITIALQYEWADFIRLILTCSHRVLENFSGLSSPNSVNLQTSTSQNSVIDDLRSNITANVNRITACIEYQWAKLDREQRLAALTLFMEVHKYLSVPQSKLTLELCKTEQLCCPGHPNWLNCSWKLIRDFILARDKPAETRILALNTFRAAYLTEKSPASFIDTGLIAALLENFVDEESHTFLETLVSFLVDASDKWDSNMLTHLVETLGTPMAKDCGKQETSTTTAPFQSASRPGSSADLMEPSLSNFTSIGLVKMFLRALKFSSSNASIVFEKLVDIARSSDHPTDCRLNALKLLYRIRCNSAGSVLVISTIENEFLVAVLCRTIDVTSVSNVNEEAPTERTLSVRGNGQVRSLNLTRPIWTYTEAKGLPEEPPASPSSNTFAYLNANTRGPPESNRESDVALRISLWIEANISLLQREKDWDIYSYVLANLGPQLINRDLFRGAIPQIQLLRSVLCEQIKNESFHEPTGWTGVKKGDVALCILHSLTMLISFHQHFAKSEQDEIVRTFMLGIGSWEGTSSGCIHALSVCCHEIPLSITKSLNAILDKMSTIITRSHIAVHILEFLALLARLPDVYINFREEEIRTVFGICVRFIQSSREQRYKSIDTPNSRSSTLPMRLSGGLKELAFLHSVGSSDSLNADDLSRYVYSLTYQVMIFWFLSLKLQDRVNHVNWITKRLIFTDEHGKEVVEEQSQVLIDMMQRVTFSDLGDTIPFDKFPPSNTDGPVVKRSWLVGMSIITIETAGATGLTQITKRQASGTTYATYQQRTAPVLPHQIPPTPGCHSLSVGPSTRTAILPSHVLLQMTTSAFPTPTSMQPMPLPDDDFTRRAITTFDRNDIVDGHKIGIIYIGAGQTDEAEILANTAGSRDYDFFLSGLGTKVSIKDAKFNTQGLYSDTDGEFTYAWRDRVTEIVYHIATMMPTDLDTDPRCINKKRHIGNDFVNIIFNHSNLHFNFDAIPSQFNFVNIVINPVCWIADPQTDSQHEAGDQPDFNQYFYIVKVMSKSDFPELSAAAIPKVVSGKNLAAFVRLIALNASVFSLVSSRRGGEYVSSWQNRLREIRRLRDRVSASSTEGLDNNGETTYPAFRRNTRGSIQPEQTSAHPGLRANFGSDWYASTDNSVFQNLDFSRWSR